MSLQSEPPSIPQGSYEDHLKMDVEVFCKLLCKGKLFWSVASGETLS